MTDGKPSLGEFLRSEREKRGITLEQVASATKISMRHLQSLEADRYIDLPAKPFIRGFVNSYVRFIGLDSDEVLTQYSDFIDTKAKDRPTRDEGHSGYVFEKREGEQSRTVLWFLMGGFIVCGAIVFVFLKPSLKHHRPSHAERLKQAAAPIASPSPLVALDLLAASSPKPTAVSSGLPLPQPSPSAFALASVEPSTTPAPTPTQAPADPHDPLNSGAGLSAEEIKHKTVFRALDDVWVRFQVDNKKPMRFILRKDKILVLRAREGIRFQASDPKRVRFNYNGAGGKTMVADKTVAVRRGGPTLFFPSQDAENIKEPFPGAKTLANTPIPAAPAPRPSSSPSP